MEEEQKGRRFCLVSGLIDIDYAPYGSMPFSRNSSRCLFTSSNRTRCITRLNLMTCKCTRSTGKPSAKKLESGGKKKRRVRDVEVRVKAVTIPKTNRRRERMVSHAYDGGVAIGSCLITLQ
jgi:hypothetical protein